MSASYQVQGDIAVITLTNPPVNGLSHAVRQRVVQGIEQAQADVAVQAVVIIGSDKGFSGGAEVREFNTPQAYAEPSLHSLNAAMDNCSKPVIAAVHGVAMGGGLELAMSCHYRVAAPGALIALPEVKLGLLPGAGGTQRLPRLLPVEMALNMVVYGEPVMSQVLAQAPGQKLFARIIDTDLRAGAMAFAREVAAQRPLPRARDGAPIAPPAPAVFDALRATLKAKARGFPAPARCVDAVQAALTLPFDAGVDFEREQFTHLVETSESKAMRHAFFAERAASKIADAKPDTPLRPIQHVAVIGAGTMGGGISMNFLNAGIPVTILEMKQEALDRGLAIIRKNYDAQVAKGKLKPQVVEQRMGLLSTTLSYEGIAQADLVIEAVFEEISVKEQVFRQLDAVMKPGAILASNTSTLDVNAIASFTRRPQDVLGMHFFSPANVMRLLEVVRGSATAIDALATVMQLAKKIKKVAVVSGVCDGFIGNRMLEQYVRQAGFLVEEGATPQQVDRALEAFGMAMGPFRVGDLAGNDIGWAIRKRRYIEKPQMRYSRIGDLICERGRFGQKTSRGWYDYEAGQREPIPSAEVQGVIETFRQQAGITPRQISDSEIVNRCILALVNEGAKILQEGIAARASDIDMVYLTGYGFPLYRGGPMFYADSLGLPQVVEMMQGLQKNPLDDTAFWQAAPLLAKLAAEGQRFNGK